MRTLTTNTKTVATPSKFQPGDLVRFTDEGFPDWIGQEGIVLSNENDGVVYRITKAAATELGPRWNTVGNISSNHADQLTVITEPAEDDPVSSPKHYTQYPVEVIELTEHMDFCRGNAVKYLARAGHKDPAKELEDLKKASWYVLRSIAKLEKELEETK